MMNDTILHQIIDRINQHRANNGPLHDIANEYHDDIVFILIDEFATDPESFVDPDYEHNT